MPFWYAMILSIVHKPPIPWDLIIQDLQTEVPSPVCLSNRQCVPWIHNSPCSGHPGIHWTTQLVQKSLSWDGKDYDNACAMCSQSWTPHVEPSDLLEPLPTLQHPGSHIVVDFITDLLNSQGTLWPWTQPRLYPELGIHIEEHNGRVNRMNQELAWSIKSYCSKATVEGSEFLPWAEYAQNSLTHSSPSITPFHYLLGYQPPLFPWSEEPMMCLWQTNGSGQARRFGRVLSPRYIVPFTVLQQINPVTPCSPPSCHRIAFLPHFMPHSSNPPKPPVSTKTSTPTPLHHLTLKFHLPIWSKRYWITTEEEAFSSI